ncbi:MAG: DUF4505 family protein [Spirochaetia bacterium]|nr:DUF4505 family protein [Spirochaetia bacterium]
MTQRAYEREYFYLVDLQGRLLHDGTPLTDEPFLRFFFKHVKDNDTGRHLEYPFISPCGREMNFVKPADTPVVFSLLRDGRLMAQGGIDTAFLPESMRFSKSGVLYHPSPVGAWGRLSSSLMLELSKAVEAWGPWYSYRGADVTHVIEPMEDAARSEFTLLRPKEDHHCFGCGTANRSGLKLSYLYHPESHCSRSWFTPGPEQSGAPGWMHGGLISLLFDETMAKVLTGLGVRAATVNLNVNFKHPCRVGHQILLEGRLVKHEGRRYHLSSVIQEKGRTLADAEAVFVSLDRA